MLNTVHLQTLVEVVRTGSFAMAARRLGYTPSAVSQQMAALERAVDAPLFEREAKSIHPSSIARLIAERAVEALAALEGLEQQIHAVAHGRKGRLRLGTFPTASARVVPLAVAALTESRPNAEILLDENEPDDLLPSVLDGELDLAVVYAYDLVPRTWPAECQVIPLLDERLVVLVPAKHRAARHDTVRMESLRDERWIASREGTAGATCLARLCAAHGFEPNITFRSNDYAAVGGLVAAGVGVAVVPALGYEPHAGISGLRIRHDDVRRHVLAIHRRANTNPLLRDALDALTRASRATQSELMSTSATPPAG